MNKHFLSVMEPILVEDYKNNEVPESMKNILQDLKNLDPSSSKNDILICLIYLLFLETGFVPKEYYDEDSLLSYKFNYPNVKKLSQKLPVGWKHHNMYSFSFILPPFPQQEVQVVCIFAAGDVLVNCIVNEIEDAQFTLCLDPLLYFSSSRCDIKSFHLQNVQHLSRNIKDNIANQAKQGILLKNEVISQCFAELPPEILLLIMNHLDVKSLVYLGQVNSVCNTLMKTPRLWIRLLLKDYPVSVGQETLMTIKNATYETIRNIYKKQYLSKSKQISRINSLYLFNLFNINL